MQDSCSCHDTHTNGVELVPSFRISPHFADGASWPLSVGFNKSADAYLSEANLLAIQNGIGGWNGGDAVNVMALLLEGKDLLAISQNDSSFTDFAVLDCLTNKLNDYVSRLNGEFAYQGRTAISLAVVAPVDASVSACADLSYRGFLLWTKALALYSAAIALAKHVLKFEEILKLKRLCLV